MGIQTKNNINNYEALPFRKYTFLSEVDKAIHTLEGILKGIAIDDLINSKEIDELRNWYKLNEHRLVLHPFNEILPKIDNALKDNVLDEEELKDLIWICNSRRTNNYYYDVITSDIQRLEGILHGILSDNEITVDETRELCNWLEENEQLIKCYPYDEIYALVISVLSDGYIDQDEKKLLKLFFSEFINIKESKNINTNEIFNLKNEITISGICTVCPELEMQNKTYCFTGISTRTTRKGFANIIESLGGTYHDIVTQKTDYLIVGADGNPCWAFSCYGRKVEAAVNLRKKGNKIMIIHENDFWDTFQGYIDERCC